MSTWHRHRAQRNSRASSIAPPGGEGWTIRDHRAILHSEPYASADLGAASDVTSKSVQSEAASASSPTPISHQLTSDVIAGTRGARLLWQAASAQGGNNDTSQAGAVGRFSAGSLRPAQSVHEGCSPNNRAFPQPPTKQRTRSCAPGLTPRAVLEKFATMQMVDVHLPTTDGRQLVLPRYTQPDCDHQLLFQQLKLNLPAQPPPRICV